MPKTIFTHDENGRFKKGNPGGPGRPKEDDSVKLNRRIAKNKYLGFFLKAIQMKICDISELTSRAQELTAYEAMALKLINRSMKDGSVHHMKLCLDLMGIQTDVDKLARADDMDTQPEEELDNVPVEKLEQIELILCS